jgi:RNA polymerase sigma-70 factor (ECF subfamily)
MATQGPEAESRAADRQIWGELLLRLRQQLSPLGFRMFEMIVVEERTADEIRESTGMTAEAVWAWRSRIAKVVRASAERHPA